MKRKETRVTEGKQGGAGARLVPEGLLMNWCGGGREKRGSRNLPGLGARMAFSEWSLAPSGTPGCSPLPEGAAYREDRRPRTVSCLLMGLLCGPGEVYELSWL